MMSTGTSKDTDRAEEKDLGNEMEFLRHQNSMLRSVVQKGIEDGKLDPSDIPSDLILDDPPLKTLEEGSKETVLKQMVSGSLEWQEMPEESPWKYDADVVCAAYERNRMKLTPREKRSPFDGMMWETEQEIKWKQLPYRLKTNEDVMLHALRARNGPKLSELPTKNQNHFPLLHAAIVHEKVDLDDVPSELLQSHHDLALIAVQNRRLAAEDCPILNEVFLREAIQDGELWWEELPLRFQTDMNFALSINKFPHSKLPERMLQYCFRLRQEESFWKLLMTNNEVLSLNLLDDFLPQRLRSQFGFMVDLCTAFPSSIELASTDLLNNREFVLAVLQKNNFVLEYLSHPMQETYLNNILDILPSLGKAINGNYQEDLPNGLSRRKSGMIFSLARNVKPSFWSQRDFVVAWIKAGLGFPDQYAHITVNVDDEWWYNEPVICYLHSLVEKELHYRGDAYRSNPEFMLYQVKANPSEYEKARVPAKYSPNVMAAAFAELPRLADQVITDLHLHEQHDKIDALVEYLNTELQPYEVFCSCILSNMLSNQSMQETGTPITLLNQGMETSFQYKICIASYLGIPTGINLQRLLCARANVQAVIAQWTPVSTTSHLPPTRSLQATEVFRQWCLARLK